MSHKHGTDEVVVSLDSEHPSHLQIILGATIIIQGIMLPTWFTATPMTVCFFAILIIGFLATHGNSFLLTNILWWFVQPVTALILIAILIYGIVKLATGSGKYGRATILPVVMVSASVLGSAIGTFLFYKYSRYLKERRN